VCDYRELPPPRCLADYVACFWTRSTSDRETDARSLILPDGCIDIVWVGERAPVIAGPATRAVRASLPAWSTIVGVRFRTGAAASMLGVPAHELLDAEVPLREVWGRRVPPSAARIAELATSDAKLGAVETVVLDRLRAADPTDPLVQHAAATLARNPEIQVSALGPTLGLSERQLRRRFEAAVGYGPKTLQRILRFQRWLHLAQQEPSGRPGLAARPGLATLAATAGYADQAHLTREVQRLAGTSPVALLVGGDSAAARLVGVEEQPNDETMAYEAMAMAST